jgi:serine/threonine protein phosphatase PrpC
MFSGLKEIVVKKKLLFFLCIISALVYASEQPYPSYATFDLCDMKNGQAYQEDRAVVDCIEQKGYLLGVLDGHCGSDVAEYASKQLPILFRQCLDRLYTEQEAFDKAFLDVEEAVVEKFTSGSTALFIYLTLADERGDKFAHIANVGDSRAVFGGKNALTFATQDQTLAREDERERVQQAGGIVYRSISFDGSEVGPWRVNNLMMSRSLGDADSKGRNADGKSFKVLGSKVMRLNGVKKTMHPQRWEDDALMMQGLIYTPKVGQVIAVPEHTKYKLTDADRWLIIATDGLWDVVKSDDALTLVQDYYDDQGLQGMAYFLCEYAVTQGSDDNITVMVVDLLNGLFDKKA